MTKSSFPWLFRPFIPQSFICLLNRYTWSTFRSDLVAGMTVAMIALPLAMAFAISSGVEPSRGLYTAVIAGFLISLLGGSRVQIGGPTGAFVVIVYSTIEKHGYDGLVAATLMAAVLLVIMGCLRLGKLIKYIPYSLIVGFTAGLAIMIFSSQIKDFFGLQIGELPTDFFGKWYAYFQAASTFHLSSTAMGLGVLSSVILMRRFMPKLPWGMIAIVLATLTNWALGLQVETIASRYGEIPSMLPAPSLPEFTWNVEWFQGLIPDALAIALLAGLESLLSALLADGMTGYRHKSDCELVGQGIANAASVLFGGIPATGAISRTAANVKTGASTPVAGMVHAIVLLTMMLLCSQLVGSIPLAALAAILMVVAWNMAELGQVVQIFRAPKGDVAVMLTAFTLTVLVDLSFAIQMGMILALFLFMKRMSDRQSAVAIASSEVHSNLPEGVEVYSVEGPLFFGIADKIQELMHVAKSSTRVCVLQMDQVHLLDASGLQALFALAKRCRRNSTTLILTGVHSETASYMKKYGLEEFIGKEQVFSNSQDGLAAIRGYPQMSPGSFDRPAV